jgi:hypothetical protein
MEREIVRTLIDLQNQIGKFNTNVEKYHAGMQKEIESQNKTLAEIKVQTTATNGTVKRHESFNQRLIGLSLISGLLVVIVSVILSIYMPQFFADIKNTNTTVIKLEQIHKGEIK